jgi:hypothetical protein
LLLKKDTELKKIITDNGIECSDKNRKAQMRSAIWTYYSPDLQLDEIEIDVSKEGDVKSIWTKLNEYLPLYFLFQSDRRNNSEDNEIQDPLKTALEQILKDDSLVKRLNEIARDVESKLKEVSERTLEKLREMNPEIADTLNPVIPAAENLKWSNVFKVSITGDQDIPINKRGSGIKRLILLNFFRAEAERKRNDKTFSNIIYAIEEPETGQHTANQKLLVTSLISLSEDQHTQVILTTHSANIIKKLDFHHLRLIQNTEKGNSPQGPVPVELSIQLEGIGGFKIASTFAIKSGILPAKYQNKFGYIITGLSHSISNNRWLTDIKTQFYLIEKGEPRGIPAGQERIFPVIDPASRSDIPTSKTVGGTTRVLEGVKYKNGEVPDDKLRFINNWQTYKGAIGSDRGRIRLYTKASLALDQLLAAAEAQSIKFKINSAYRTYSDQVAVFNTNCSNGPFNGASCVAKPKKGLAANPGRSNHGFGLAVDFSTPGDLKKLTTSTNQYKWLLANAAKYGFKRLPWGNRPEGENWEAWHWEYQVN